jgi:toxin ParE1/3/4
MPPRRRTHLSAAAEQDFAAIIAWAAEQFGPKQPRRYRDVIVTAIGLLDQGPLAQGSQARNEIMRGLRSLHLARPGQPAQQVLLYREGKETDTEIVRILHDSMEIRIHLPRRDEEIET